MKISVKEMESVSHLNAFDRYKYFIKKVADFERVYSLKNNNDDFAIAKVDNHQVVSLWPAMEFAQRFIANEWLNYRVVEFELLDFNNEIIHHLKSAGYILNIFPVENKAGFVVSTDELFRDLSEELQKYK